MPYEREIPDFASKFFEDFKAHSGLPTFPLATLQLAGFKRFLEFQLFMMKRYQSALKEQLTQDPMHDVMSQMTKRLMSGMLEFNRFAKASRRQATEAQLDGVGQMIQMCEEFLHSLAERGNQPPTNAPYDAG
jgi:hypothetical protein